MISSKQMYSTYFKEYQLSNNDLKKLQETLFLALLDIDKICKENNIEYMLSGGTALGAVRHQGFIPWDDDIDIMMTRANYHKLIAAFRKNHYDKYQLVEPTTKGYFFKQPKIFLKNSTYTELPFAGNEAFNMLFIDVFIIEYLPNNKFKRLVEEKIYNFAYKASSLCIDYLYPSPPILEKCKIEKEVKKYYNFRRRLGHIFSVFFGMNFYLKKVEKIAKRNDKTDYMGIPAGISYGREIMPAQKYLETTEVSFEGHKFKIPKDYGAYFENLYGKDYMTPPPENKREIHVAYKFEL